MFYQVTPTTTPNNYIDVSVYDSPAVGVSDGTQKQLKIEF